MKPGEFTMRRIAVVTDSNSGLTKAEAAEYGIYILPMTFFVDGKECLEGVSLREEEFFDSMRSGYTVSTTQPTPGELSDLWEELLAAVDIHEVTFTWIKGHAGHDENERCDALATAAADGDDLMVDEGYVNGL